MKELLLKTTIIKHDNVKDFIDDFKLDKDDLILASKVVYDSYFAKYDLPCEVLADASYEKGEPTDELVETIYKSITRTPKRVIAIGGGSIIDIAKLLSLKDVMPVDDLYDGLIKPIKDKELIVLPTTCGTGSEVTNVSILALLKKGTKKGLQVDALYPNYAVLIPELLTNLPDRVFGTSSIDALIHCVESALSPKATDTTKMFSYKGIEMIINSYKEIVKGGKETRIALYPKLLLAATYGGIAFGNAGTGAVHAMSYPLGAKYHVPHGESNYVLFTAVLKEYLSQKNDGELLVMNKYLANLLDCDLDNVYDSLEELLNNIVLKKPMHEYGVTEADLVEFSKSCYENQQRLLVNNFVPFDEATILKVYKTVY